MTGADSVKREALLLLPMWSRPSCCWAAGFLVVLLLLVSSLGREVLQASETLTWWRVKCAGEVPGVFSYVAGEGESNGANHGDKVSGDIISGDYPVTRIRNLLNKVCVRVVPTLLSRLSSSSKT